MGVGSFSSIDHSKMGQSKVSVTWGSNEWRGMRVLTAVVGSGEERDEVPPREALEAVHDALVRSDDEL